jgi:hypothetical protein
MSIWYILWSFGIFPRFGMLYQEKSGSPGPQEDVIVKTHAESLTSIKRRGRKKNSIPKRVVSDQ